MRVKTTTLLGDRTSPSDCINPFPNKPWFLQYKSFENTVGKGEIACNEQFLLFPQCFLPIRRNFCHFHQIWNCRLQTFSVWKRLKFVVWERVTHTVWSRSEIFYILRDILVKASYQQNFCGAHSVWLKFKIGCQNMSSSEHKDQLLPFILPKTLPTLLSSCIGKLWLKS